jgi:2'-5' RNA ligase
MRLFFAVELPADVQRALGKLRPVDNSRDYRWVDPSLMHLTLAFLGEQPAERLDDLQRVGQAAARMSQPARLRLGEAGGFGARKIPRVLWVSLAGDLGALGTLQTNLVHGLSQAGFKVEDRPFRPHITLARRRESAVGGAPPGWPWPLPASPAFELRGLTLFESRLSPRGATYVSIFHFPLSQVR